MQIAKNMMFFLSLMLALTAMKEEMRFSVQINFGTQFTYEVHFNFTIDTVKQITFFTLNNLPTHTAIFRINHNLKHT